MDSIRYAPIQFGSIWKPHSAIPNSQIIYLCNCRMQITQGIRRSREGTAKTIRRRRDLLVIGAFNDFIITVEEISAVFVAVDGKGSRARGRFAILGAAE
nr:hypothetical protein Iba_scaffold28965CG0010 [Ipomoea batatas]